MLNILITGANRGLGFALVEQYAGKNNNIIACCRNPLEATQLSDLSKKLSDEISIIKLDLNDERSITELGNKLKNKKLDILFNVAGIYEPRASSFGKLNFCKWQNILTVNTISPIILTQVLAPNLQKGSARIVVNISSVTGKIDYNLGKNRYMYPSSKIAINALTRILSDELLKIGIIIIAIEPGYIKSDMSDNQGIVELLDSAAAIENLVAKIQPIDSGKFFSYCGEEIR